MKKEMEEALLAKYACVPDLQAPKLNPQILATLEKQSGNGKKRDAHMVKIQDISGLALSILGSLITNIYEHRNEGLDLVELIEPLKDAGNLLSLQMFKQSKNRKAFIEPGLSKGTIELLKDTKIGEFLHGEDLSTKLKENKALSKQGEELLKPTPSTSSSVNFKIPYRPNLRGGMGSTPFAGRGRPRFAFRGNRRPYGNQRGRTPQRQQIPIQQQQPPKQTK